MQSRKLSRKQSDVSLTFAPVKFRANFNRGTMAGSKDSVLHGKIKPQEMQKIHTERIRSPQGTFSRHEQSFRDFKRTLKRFKENDLVDDEDFEVEHEDQGTANMDVECDEHLMVKEKKTKKVRSKERKVSWMSDSTCSTLRNATNEDNFSWLDGIDATDASSLKEHFGTLKRQNSSASSYINPKLKSSSNMTGKSDATLNVSTSSKVKENDDMTNLDMETDSVLSTSERLDDLAMFLEEKQSFESCVSDLNDDTKSFINLKFGSFSNALSNNIEKIGNTLKRIKFKKTQDDSSRGKHDSLQSFENNSFEHYIDSKAKISSPETGKKKVTCCVVS